MSRFTNTIPGIGLNDATETDAIDFEQYGVDLLERAIDTASDVGMDYVEKQAREITGTKEETPKTTYSESQAVVQKPTVTQPTSQIPVKAQQPASGGTTTDTIISKVKQVPPWLAGGVVGVAVKYFSKSWIGALASGGATWFLTNKWQQS